MYILHIESVIKFSISYYTLLGFIIVICLKYLFNILYNDSSYNILVVCRVNLELVKENA